MKEFVIRLLDNSNKVIIQKDLDSIEECKSWANGLHTYHRPINKDEHFEIHHNIGEISFLRSEYVAGSFIWVEVELIFNVMDEIHMKFHQAVTL